jgi:hypothetical protein
MGYGLLFVARFCFEDISGSKMFWIKIPIKGIGQHRDHVLPLSLFEVNRD